MSKQYDLYLENHKANVTKAFKWFKRYMPALARGLDDQICLWHDDTKTNSDEYDAYDAYFYGKKKTKQVEEEFNRAWLIHQHSNPHHWQYWVLITDDAGLGRVVALDIPDNYILEMICDWWSFGWGSGDLYEIFKWYDEHKKYMKLSKNTRAKVEEILGTMEQKLKEGKINKVGGR